MGRIINEKKVETVGELIAALQQFPADMALDIDMESKIAVFQVKPQRGEVVADKRGYIGLRGADFID